MTIQLLNGLVYGALLFTVASGLALMFGLRRIVNFAHGSLYMLGAYIGYSASKLFGFWIALVAAGACLAMLGALLDGAVFRPLQRRGPLTTLLVTFGLALIAEDLVLTVWGKDTLSLPAPALLAGDWSPFATSFPAYRLMMIAFGAVAALGLLIWLKGTRIGLFVRAASHDPVISAVQGINTDRLGALVVAVGAALAGMSGVVAAPLLSLTPSMAGDILVDSFIVVVVGGLGSIGGAFVTALVLGQINVLGVVFMPELTSLLPFFLMIAVLVWKPAGLAGERV
ncbi:MAG TPA: branched-chain amino acid ABC transporter permease [Xanthobacteraceae bacterium]|nr:branched-chain amino acid ABC transporter permease [Xanthobacteraceae bacterium]